MRRILAAGLALGFNLLGATFEASAEARPCTSCGTSTSTTLRYRTIHPLLFVTRYHDRSVYHQVTRLHYIVDVTRIQPIIRLHDVTRIHHVMIVRDAYAVDQQAPTPYVQQIPAYAPGCGCMD